VVLCAGYGTRLYPLTKEAPKALLPIRGKPILEYICDKIQLLDGVDKVFIVVNGRFFGQFKAWLDNYPARLPVKLINDGSKNHKDRLGAVRDLAFVVEKENITDDILVLGGDNLFDFGLAEFIKRSLNVSPNPVIGIYNLDGKCKAKKYGVVKTNREGRVIDFCEKPQKLNGSRLVSLCLYYLPKQTLHLLDEYIKNAIHNTHDEIRYLSAVVRRTKEDTRYALRDLSAVVRRTKEDTHDELDSIGNYIKWLAKKSEMYGFTFKGTWFDIGDIDSYTEAVCSF